MIEFIFVDPSKEFLFGIDYSNGEADEDFPDVRIIAIGFILFEIIIYF